MKVNQSLGPPPSNQRSPPSRLLPLAQALGLFQSHPRRSNDHRLIESFKCNLRNLRGEQERAEGRVRGRRNFSNPCVPLRAFSLPRDRTIFLSWTLRPSIACSRNCLHSLSPSLSSCRLVPCPFLSVFLLLLSVSPPLLPSPSCGASLAPEGDG
jgi:hypothetical protein